MMWSTASNSISTHFKETNRISTTQQNSPTSTTFMTSGTVSSNKLKTTGVSASYSLNPQWSTFRNLSMPTSFTKSLQQSPYNSSLNTISTTIKCVTASTTYLKISLNSKFRILCSRRVFTKDSIRINTISTVPTTFWIATSMCSGFSTIIFTLNLKANCLWLLKNHQIWISVIISLKKQFPYLLCFLANRQKIKTVIRKN